MRNFNGLFGKIRPSINNYNYYVDFEKVYANVEGIRIELNIMNSLIGSKNIEADFMVLLKLYPEILIHYWRFVRVRYMHRIQKEHSFLTSIE